MFDINNPSNINLKPYYKNMISGEPKSVYISGGFFLISFACIFSISLWIKSFSIRQSFSFSEHYLLTLFLLMMIFLTLFLFLKNNNIIKKSKEASKNWKKIEADVVDLKIKVFMSPSHRGRTTFHYIPDITYKYDIDDISYTSKQVSFDEKKVFEPALKDINSYYYGVSKHNKPNELFKKWDKTKKVDIFYNPKNPQESVIYLTFKYSMPYYRPAVIFTFLTMLVNMIFIGLLII